MRLIDADALKEDLTRFYAGEVTARDLIDKQPTISGWINVTDELPKKKGDYLIYNTDGLVWPYWYDDGWYDSNGYISDSVTHWMPLPEPPKEE